ncbi:hypothetical protein LJ739_17950 [Aestuariibacter halophilus]|uniref:Uncharacterized protein n=1 Tax=Fluctibacter halophilus TaxID=226011 RepID=A0ABS8GEC5_9ALTE|nr:hypothetical protein [Aestuariibacter halophilus]MCC2618144.1 hypothetical protein [Aestuariibacter halophilus]
MTESEIAAELYRQTAFSSSILGGFALTFLSILMTLVDSSAKVFLTAIGALTVAVVLLLVATLGATYILIGVQQLQLTYAFEAWPTSLYRTKWIAELSFMFGIIALMTGIGLSGYSKSRMLGHITLFPAILGTVLLVVIFSTA